MKLCKICSKRKKFAREYCDECLQFIADRRKHDQKQVTLNFPNENMKADYQKMKKQGFF